MNLTGHCNIIREKANQMSQAMWSLVFGAVLAYLVWTFAGDAPWWIYALLSVRPVLGFAQALSDGPALHEAADARFREPPMYAGESPGNAYLLKPGTRTRDLLHAGCVIGTLDVAPPKQLEPAPTFSASGFQDSAHCHV